MPDLINMVSSFEHCAPCPVALAVDAAVQRTQGHGRETSMETR